MGLGLICGSEWGDLTALCIKRGLTPHFIPLRAAALDRNGRARSRGAPAEGWIVALGPDGRPFAILRVEKVKSLGELRGRGSHNARTAERGTEHCDPSEPPELIAGDPDAVAAWHRRAKACGVSPDHMRANGTVALEWMATASPEWFAKATPQQVAEWVRDSLAHIEERAGGAANILAAHVHLDETTPHIQATTIPLVQKAVGRRGRRPKGEPAPAPAEPSWRLSARDLVGGSKETLCAIQDDYAEAMAGHGLRRGIPRKETGARNRPPAQYRAELAAMGDSLAARAASLDERERALARKAAVLDAVRREMGHPPSPALADIANERPRPLRGAIDPRPKDRGLRD